MIEVSIGGKRGPRSRRRRARKKMENRAIKTNRTWRHLCQNH